jgi:hypothetical protein
MTGDRRVVGIEKAREAGKRSGAGKSGASILVGPRYVGLKARYTPAIELLVVAELTAPNEPSAIPRTCVECRADCEHSTSVGAGCRRTTSDDGYIAGPGNGTVGHAIAVWSNPACVQPNIPAGPVHRRRRRRRLRLERHICRLRCTQRRADRKNRPADEIEKLAHGRTPNMHHQKNRLSGKLQPRVGGVCAPLATLDRIKLAEPKVSRCGASAA